MNEYVGYIYKTTNLINNKFYIGMHRTKENKVDKKYYGSGKALKRALEKYGKENFIVEILDWCKTEEDLCNKEIEYIIKFNAVENDLSYNMKDGGIGGWNIDVSGENNPMYGTHRSGKDNPAFGIKHSKESRQKQSESIAKNGGHHGKKNPMYGKRHSEESKEKMRKASKHLKPMLGRTKENHPCYGLYWWCDGINPPIKSKDCPGPEYHRGRK